jgi:hypothetical protein
MPKGKNSCDNMNRCSGVLCRGENVSLQRIELGEWEVFTLGPEIKNDFQAVVGSMSA